MRRPRLIPIPLLGALLALVLIQVTVTAYATGMNSSSWSPGTSMRPVRIYYDNAARLSELGALDLLEYRNLDDHYVLALVTEEELAWLHVSGWQVVPDQQLLSTLPARNRFYDGYLTADEIDGLLGSLNEMYPALTDVVVYGRSYCHLHGGCQTSAGDFNPGKELSAFRITNKETPGSAEVIGSQVVPGSKPVFILVAGLHARELTTAEIAVRWLTMLLEEYGKDPDITWLVDWHDLWIVPVANPDGRWAVELGSKPPYDGAPLMHRKNLDQDADADGRQDCDVWPSNTFQHVGVDLNRNHSYAWQEPGLAVSPCAQTYSGIAPASEPETRALQDLVRALLNDGNGAEPGAPTADDRSGMLISLHNFSDLVLYPWGHSSDPAPDHEKLRSLAEALAALNGYRACQPHECLYLANGTTDDWAYGELGIPAFTFEIGSPVHGFMPPYSVIDDEQWPENRDALLLAAGLAQAPYELIDGPQVVQLALTAVGDGLLLSATIDDIDRGADTIAGAEFTIGLPFWEKASTIHVMAPAADQRPGTRASFTAFLEQDDLPGDRPIVYVRGIDAAGNYGLAKAIFVDSPYPQRLFFPITFIGAN